LRCHVVIGVSWFWFSRHQRRHGQDATPTPGSKDFFRLFSFSLVLCGLQGEKTRKPTPDSAPDR
jgi:hypothetical protein